MYNNKISVKKYTPKNVQFFIVFLCPIQSESIEKGHNPRMKKKKWAESLRALTQNLNIWGSTLDNSKYISHSGLILHFSSVLRFFFIFGFLGTPTSVSLFTPFSFIGVGLVFGFVTITVVAVPFSRSATTSVLRSVSLFTLLFLPTAFLFFIVTKPHLPVDILSKEWRESYKWIHKIIIL